MYEFTISRICEEYTQKEIAGLYVNYQEMYHHIREDNDSLRKENETLKYLIAKYRIETDEIAEQLKGGAE